MGSWLYAHMVPGHGHQLEILEAPRILLSTGCELDPKAALVLPDEDGHCETRGEEIDLGPDPLEAAMDLLESGKDLMLTFRNVDLLFVCMSAINARTQHIMVSWSQYLFEKMTKGQRERHMQMLARFAGVVGAFAVVVTREPPGYFEDRIVIVDEMLLVETALPYGGTVDISEVWLIGGSAVIEGVELEQLATIDRFRRYCSKNFAPP